MFFLKTEIFAESLLDLNESMRMGCEGIGYVPEKQDFLFGNGSRGFSPETRFRTELSKFIPDTAIANSSPMVAERLRPT